MIYGECFHEVSVQARVCTVRSFKKCNEEELTSELANAPWQVMDTFSDIDDKWNFWKSLFLNVIETHAPLVRVRRKMKGQDDWIDSEL